MRISRLAALAFAFSAPWVAGTVYRIDPLQTRADFSVRFLGVIPIHGQFASSRGTLEYDGERRGGKVEVIIDANSLYGGGDTARGADFFAVDRYPTITFRSTRFIWGAEHLKAIEGQLTLTGTTQPVTIDIESSGCIPQTGREPARCHAEGEVTVSRTRFGMTGWQRTVSDDVVIHIRLAAVAEPK